MALPSRDRTRRCPSKPPGQAAAGGRRVALISDPRMHRMSPDLLSGRWAVASRGVQRDSWQTCVHTSATMHTWSVHSRSCRSADAAARTFVGRPRGAVVLPQPVENLTAGAPREHPRLGSSSGPRGPGCRPAASRDPRARRLTGGRTEGHDSFADTRQQHQAPNHSPRDAPTCPQRPPHTARPTPSTPRTLVGQAQGRRTPSSTAPHGPWDAESPGQDHLTGTFRRSSD